MKHDLKLITPRFVAYYFKRFFEQNNAQLLKEQLDSDLYRELHQKLLLRLTRREKQKQLISDQVQSSMAEIEQQRQQNWNKKEIRIPFTFESGPMLNFKHELYDLWKKYYIYDGAPMNNVTLKIRTRSNKSLSQLLIKKKPQRSLLRS